MQTVRGTISDVVFSNDENGYSIVEIEAEGGLGLVVTGTIPFPGCGEVIEAEGEFVNHALYGQQFKASKITRSFPEDTGSLYLFLASGSVKGIGMATARRIVNAFGADSIRILEEEPERLAEIKGITLKKASEIGTSFRKLSAVRGLTEFLSGSGLEPSIAMELYRRFGDEALTTVLSDPYLLVSFGLTPNFRAVDRLAEKQGIDRVSPKRIDSALIFTLERALEDGHCCYPEEALAERAASLLDVEIGLCLEGLRRTASENRLIMEEDLYYLPRIYHAECHVAERIADLSKVKYKVPKGLMMLIEKAASELLVDYTALQTEALRVAAENGVMVLTGGPGTGKTTAIRGMIAMLEGLGADVALAAPTGRAAKRMSELCQREAKTIHRLLEVTVDGRGDLIFNRTALNPLEADAVILDELSMVDIELMSSLLAALKKGARLILVGDADQLPSVGPGSVLADIIRSGEVKCVHLDEIFRQAHESNIIVGAHEVNHGKLPSLGEKKGDLFFLRRPNAEEMKSTVVDLVTRRLPKNMGIPPEDIQVLLPNRRGAGGTEELNQLLQAAVNPEEKWKKQVKTTFGLFREGDRVMQTANNYELEWRKNDSSERGMGIFNGDVGVILAIDNEARHMVIRFDERTAVYGFDMLDQLELAYAVTVHKSQGSEYPVVIFGASLGRSRLLTRCLFYTAMTRAKKLLIIVGREESLEEMVVNARSGARFTRLAERIQNGVS